jgi:hypothetical protein
MNRVAQNTGSEQRLESPAIHNVAWPIEELANIKLQSGVFENADWSRIVKLYQYIDVALGCRFPARHGTKHRGMCHTEPPQFILVIAQ